MKISMVIATHNRAKFFIRSLFCYAHQTFKDFEILLLDDGSTDDLRTVCQETAPSLGLDLKHFWFHRPNGFRDCAAIINYGIRAAAGDFIMFTSPEVMPGRTLMEQMWSSQQGPGDLTFYTAKCYLLTQAMQQLLDTVDWKGMGVSAAVRTLPDFYNQPTADPSHYDTYLARNIDSAAEFVTNMMSGMTRAGWKNMGGFPESDVWGPGDLSWLNERHRRGVPLRTLQDMDSICVHQNHDGPGDIITPRDIQVGIAHTRTGPWDFIRW